MHSHQSVVHQCQLQTTALLSRPRLQHGLRRLSSATDGRLHRPGVPRRIVLIRHGESEGNIDETAYVRTADWRIPLTERGRQQAADAGRKLKKVLGDRPTMWYVSPYVRTQQTLTELLKQWHSAPTSRDRRAREEVKSHVSLGIREEPRIAEQQFGNFQNVEEVLAAKEERQRFGRFWYRFPSGESGLDVYSRTTSFISTMFRDMRAIQHMLSSPSGTAYEHYDASESSTEYNIVIVTHGLTLRLFLMRWLRWSVMAFENSYNPPNAAVIVMERRQDSSGSQWFALHEKSAELLNIGPLLLRARGPEGVSSRVVVPGLIAGKRGLSQDVAGDTNSRAGQPVEDEWMGLFDEVDDVCGKGPPNLF